MSNLKNQLAIKKALKEQGFFNLFTYRTSEDHEMRQQRRELQVPK